MRRGRFIRSGTSRGAHIRALHAALCYIYETATCDPAAVRPGGGVRIMDHIKALERAYPQLLKVHEVDLAQHFAEEDGDAVEP